MLLAAGASSRMGANKLALPFADSTVIARALDAALSGCERVILVTGRDAGSATAALTAAQRGEPPSRLLAVGNPAWRSGMLSSIAAGLALVATEWCFIAHADMPLVLSLHYKKLFDSLSRGGGQPGDTDAVFFEREGESGNPVLLRVAAVRALRLPPEGERLKPFLRFLRRRTVDTDDPAVFADVDTPDAYRASLHLI